MELLWEGSRYVWHSFARYEGNIIATTVRVMRIRRTLTICFEIFVEDGNVRTRIGSNILTLEL